MQLARSRHTLLVHLLPCRDRTLRFRVVAFVVLFAQSSVQLFVLPMLRHTLLLIQTDQAQGHL